MKDLISGFIPWIFFSVFYGTTPESMSFAGAGALILTIIFNMKELRHGFILPWASIIFFSLLSLNDHFAFYAWPEQHALIIIDSALAAIVWFSMLIGKPFTLQYARLKIDPAFWQSPGFIKVNWMITSVWAILMTAMAIPSYVIPQDQLLDSWFWNYGFGVLCIVIALRLTKKIPSWYTGRMFWNAVKHLPPVDSPYLKAGFAPVKDEVDLEDLKIEGNLPVTLNGSYLRNGPNPYFTPYTYTYPFDGDGMIHKMTLAHGWAAYRNRFVKTKNLNFEQKAGKALYGGFKMPLMPDPKYVKDSDPTRNCASVHIARFGDKLLAFYEASSAYELNDDLQTIGEWRLPNKKKLEINAHHRRDLKTGHFYACTYAVDKAPYLTVYEFDQHANLLKTIPIEKLYSTMIHDFVITENYIIFFDTPAIFDLQGLGAHKDFLSFQQDKPTRIILLHKVTHEVQVIETESFFVYHFVNAYEQNHKIMIDFVHHESLNVNPAAHPSKRGPRLYRAEIDLTHMTYHHFSLCDEKVEFPTYALALTGQPYRYAYCCTETSNKVEHFNAILKYDFLENKHELFSFGDDIEVDEAIFVPEANPKSEDHGYLMLYIYHKNQDTSDFVLLDAKSPGAKPIATIPLGRRVPHGLHGSWVPR